MAAAVTIGGSSYHCFLALQHQFATRYASISFSLNASLLNVAIVVPSSPKEDQVPESSRLTSKARKADGNLDEREVTPEESLELSYDQDLINLGVLS